MTVFTLSFMLPDDTEVGRAKCAAVPRVGEFIWLQCSSEHARKHDLETTTTAWRVKEVAYWMADTDAGLEIESTRVAVYVEKHPSDFTSESTRD